MRKSVRQMACAVVAIGICVPASLDAQGSLEVIEPRRPDFVVYTVEARCGANSFKIVYTTGSTIARPDVLSVSANNVELHIRELARISSRTLRRPIERVQFGECLYGREGAGVRFRVGLAPRATGTLVLEEVTFDLVNAQITPASR